MTLYIGPSTKNCYKVHRFAQKDRWHRKVSLQLMAERVNRWRWYDIVWCFRFM